jgi:hypothetical protein
MQTAFIRITSPLPLKHCAKSTCWNHRKLAPVQVQVQNLKNKETAIKNLESKAPKIKTLKILKARRNNVLNIQKF